MKPLINPRKFYERLRTFYCAHYRISRQEFERLCREKQILMADVIGLARNELCKLENVGLYEQLYAEKIRQRKERKEYVKKKCEEIESQLKQLGFHMRLQGYSDEERVAMQSAMSRLSKELTELTRERDGEKQ